MTPGHMELSDAPEKIPSDRGIDPGTLRLVAQCLNHYVIPGSQILYRQLLLNNQFKSTIYYIWQLGKTGKHHSLHSHKTVG